jgi:hypothetical protein
LSAISGVAEVLDLGIVVKKEQSIVFIYSPKTFSIKLNKVPFPFLPLPVRK